MAGWRAILLFRSQRCDPSSARPSSASIPPARPSIGLHACSIHFATVLRPHSSMNGPSRRTKETNLVAQPPPSETRSVIDATRGVGRGRRNRRGSPRRPCELSRTRGGGRRGGGGAAVRSNTRRASHAADAKHNYCSRRRSDAFVAHKCRRPDEGGQRCFRSLRRSNSTAHTTAPETRRQ